MLSQLSKCAWQQVQEWRRNSSAKGLMDFSFIYHFLSKPIGISCNYLWLIKCHINPYPQSDKYPVDPYKVKSIAIMGLDLKISV